jgi:WXG100 family type VII secretion target
MSAEILVTPSELREHARAVENEARQVGDQLAALRSRLTQLSSQFKGKAAAAFDTRYDEWDTNARGLLDALDSLGKFLENAATTIEDVDNQLASGLG